MIGIQVLNYITLLINVAGRSFTHSSHCELRLTRTNPKLALMCTYIYRLIHIGPKKRRYLPIPN